MCIELCLFVIVLLIVLTIFLMAAYNDTKNILFLILLILSVSFEIILVSSLAFYPTTKKEVNEILFKEPYNVDGIQVINMSIIKGRYEKEIVNLNEYFHSTIDDNETIKITTYKDRRCGVVCDKPFPKLEIVKKDVLLDDTASILKRDK